MSQDLLTLKQFAEVLAHQEHYGDEHAAEVRERLGVANVWDDSVDHWLDELHDDALREEPQLSPVFAKSLGDTNSSLQQDTPPLDRLVNLRAAEAPEPTSDELEAEPASESEADSAEAEPASAQVPPPAVVPAPSPGGAPPPSAPLPVDAPAMVAPAPKNTGPSPWAKGRPAPPAVTPPPVASPPVAPSITASTNETAFVTAIVLDDPLPFGDEPSAQPPAAAGDSDIVNAAGMTAEVPALLELEEPLPFVDASTAQSPPASSPVVAPPPDAQESPASTNETAFVAAVEIDDPLPFDDEPAAQPPSSATGGDALDAAGMTTEVAAIFAGDEPLPFIGNTASHVESSLVDKLTLEQYASLRAELAVRPEDHGGTLRRYGIDAAAYESLERAWSQKLEPDPAARQRYDQLFDNYRAWLLRQAEGRKS